ncbi:MAG: alpha/beta hydrolase fold domain-containing protein [Candidatus Micrarchaeales archaeon]
MQNIAIIGIVILIIAVVGGVFYFTSNHQPLAPTTVTTTALPTVPATTSIFAATSIKTTTSVQTTSVSTVTTTVQPHSNNLQVPWQSSNGNYTAVNQTYCTSGANQLHLDLYANAPLNYSSVKNGLRPIAVFVHGGGLTSGDKAQIASDSAVFPVIINDLISNGFIVASVNYNLAPAYKYPNQTDDVLCAMRFLRYYAQSFDGNSSQIAIFGDSSGGQLVSTDGVTNGTAAWENKEGLKIYGATNLTAAQLLSISTKPQVVGDFYGSVNNTIPFGMTQQQAQQYDPQGYQNLVTVYNYNSTLMYEASPIQYVTAGEPPFLIFQGNNDTMVPASMSQAFYNSLKAAGDNATLIIVNNSGHRFVPTPSGSQIHPGIGYIANYTVAFFKKIFPRTATSATTPTNQSSSQSTSTPQTQNPAYIVVADPVNISQVSQISKFRSCEGHDYSGYDVQGFQETQRSMKHYFTPKPQFAGSTSQIQEFAPFNGTIESIVNEQTPVGKQVWIGYTSTGPQGGYPPLGVWNAVFFHLNPLPGITAGSHVTAGQLIGYANQTAPIQEFDIAFEEYNGSNGIYHQVLDSIFNHMSPQVLSQFAAHGINQSDMIYSKAYRDANPCNFNTFNPNDSVTLS